MLLYLLSYTLSFVIGTEAKITPKCCPREMQVKEEMYKKLNCIEKNNTRNEVWSDTFNFLYDHSEGECLDFNGEVFNVYITRSSVLVSKNIVAGPYFRKCCPLDYVYDTRKHSCQKNETKYFPQSQTIKVGLPHCQIITDKVFKTNNEVSLYINGLNGQDYCLDEDINGHNVIRQCQKEMNHCEDKRCIKKCCPDGQSFVKGPYCRDTHIYGLDSQRYSSYIDNVDSDYDIIYGAKCPEIAIIKRNNRNYTITSRGYFRFFRAYVGKFIEHHYSSLQSYCFEHVTGSGYYLFRCMPQTKAPSYNYTSIVWAEIMSCIFLVATIIVINVNRKDNKGLFPKILSNYCIAIIFLLGTHATSLTLRMHSGLQCTITGYLLIFSISCAFTWINIMALEIWWTLGCTTNVSYRTDGNLKKLLKYMLYGWGVPLCHTLLILLLVEIKVLHTSLQPYVGKTICFIENGYMGSYGETVWLLLPELIVQIINTVLFLKTIIHCAKIRNEINEMNDSAKQQKNRNNRAQRERLLLVVKLSVITGVWWIFEVATSFTDIWNNPYIEILAIISDNITGLQGVFIFLVFVCRKTAMVRFYEKMINLGRIKISTATPVKTETHVSSEKDRFKEEKSIQLNRF